MTHREQKTIESNQNWRWQLAKMAMILLWLIAHLAWGVMGIMGLVFAAEGLARAGRPPSSEGGFYLSVGFLIGVTIAGLAGIPGGHAMNRPIGQRASPVRWFAGMYAMGALIQIAAWVYLFAAS